MSEHHEKTGYEKKDVDVKKLMFLTLVPSLIIVVCLIGLDQYMLLANEHKYYQQVLSVEDARFKELVQKETHLLNNYKITDQKIRIPIERAMELIVQEGTD